jgi:hypothetical protein
MEILVGPLGFVRLKMWGKFGSSTAPPDKTLNGLLNAVEVLIFRGNNGRLFRTVTSEAPKGFAGFRNAIGTADFDGDGTPATVVGIPYEDADLIGPDGDVETHLQPWSD